VQENRVVSEITSKSVAFISKHPAVNRFRRYESIAWMWSACLDILSHECTSISDHLLRWKIPMRSFKPASHLGATSRDLDIGNSLRASWSKLDVRCSDCLLRCINNRRGAQGAWITLTTSIIRRGRTLSGPYKRQSCPALHTEQDSHRIVFLGTPEVGPASDDK
jgi:hypothetical protein